MKNKKLIVIVLVAIAVAIVVKMTVGGGIAGIEPAAGEMQAMPVQATKVKSEKIQVWKKFSGSVVAVDWAEIRPQVDGRITEVRFEDGQYVQKDDILFVIDPRPYKAALAEAEAALSAAMTQASLAEKEYQRAQKLIETDAISHRLLDERANARQTASAAVKGAKALVEAAKLDLDYAYVKAPFSGKTSRAEITEGNLVQSGGNAPVLTTLVGDENVYVDFEIDDQTYLNYVRQHDDGEGHVPVRVNLGGEMEYTGHVQSFDNRIDSLTGTIRARALFSNDDKALLPGMSVTVYMGSNGDEGRILVTEHAIGTDQDRKFVYVIGDDNVTAYREVKLGESISGQRIITSGLEDGETVVTEGIVRIQPGIPVIPQFGDEKHSQPQEPNTENMETPMQDERAEEPAEPEQLETGDEGEQDL